MKAYQLSLLSETSPAHHQLVLADEAVGVVAHSAGTGVLAEFSGMTVELFGHVLAIGGFC